MLYQHVIMLVSNKEHTGGIIMNQYITRKYNGVNHDLLLYQNPEDFAVNRKSQYFLVNQEAKPNEVIRQRRPLSAKSQLISLSSMEKSLFLPEAVGAQIEFVPDPYEYDIIIVSNLYANIARQMQGINPDYVDRLYSPVPLYSENPQDVHYSSKIGCVGFRKVWDPRTPQEYICDLKSGRLPSVSSMKLCVAMYRSQRAYCDYNTTFWLRELENYLLSI